MTLDKLAGLIDAQIAVKGTREAESAMATDLLSWAMGKGVENMAWVTIQTHMNVIAVSSLLEFSCVILPNGAFMEPPVINKALQEGIAVLYSPLSTYEICGRLYAGGISTAVR